jgi:hypothetical protein
MSNGDPLRVGLTQPPDNRATAATLLVHNGSSFGTQHTAFWVQRLGGPACEAAVRGDNFSTGQAPGVMRTGVLGMIEPGGANRIGVLGTSSASGAGIFWGETGVLGVTNSFGVVGEATTGLVLDEPSGFVSATGVVGRCDDGVGVHGVATTGWGIIGESVNRAGVTGTSSTASGVNGRSNQSSGVTGTSTGGNGVEGTTTQGPAGVLGRATTRYGVLGTAEQGVGVYGESPNNAIQGWSTGTGGASIGVAGFSEVGAGVQGDSTTGIGVAGRSPRGWAGYFGGNVVVLGNFYVTGAKSAVAPHPDGTTRALFCVESPESYFEDFGETVLDGASVSVDLDPDFAALVQRARYQVFLTSYGPEALYVSARRPDSFEIARVEQSGGGIQKRIRVGYRIVARRADVKRSRLPTVEVPPEAGQIQAPMAPRRRGRQTTHAAWPEPEPLPGTPRVPRPSTPTLADAPTVPATRRSRPAKRRR